MGMWGMKPTPPPVMILTGIGEQKYGDKPHTCPRTYFTVLLPQVGVPPKGGDQRLSYIFHHADFIIVAVLN